MALELISIHIPKTGGTSFQNVLRQFYGESHLLHVKRKQARSFAGHFDEIIQPDTKVLHGHFTYPEIRNICEDEGIKLVSWLRDPVKRVLSNYYFFIKRVRENVHSPNAHRYDETLIQYASKENSRNRMSKFLKGIDLQDLFFTGVIEFIEEDLNRFIHQMDWPLVQSAHLNNNNAYKTTLSPPEEEVLEQIAALNQEDIALYNAALEMREGFIRKGR